MRYSQVKEYIIIPVLKQMSIPYSEEAVELLAMTAAHESNGGEYIKQVKGPACGIYQMEPATHEDIWDNYLDYRDTLKDDVVRLTSFCEVDAQEMVGNLYYATALARIHYWRVSSSLPKRSDYSVGVEWLENLAQYAKEHYNTHLGKATPAKYLTAYLRWRNEG